jgi:chondroitin AC lyase
MECTAPRPSTFVSPHDPLSARKAWFFFDDEFVSLGAGISSDGEYPVATTFNQCRLNGEVVVSAKDGWLNMQQDDHDLESALWIHHDSIAYVFPNPQNVRLSNKTESGTWRSINRQQWATDEEVQEDVFKLWIDHGHTPSQEKYAYIVVPGIKGAGRALPGRHPDTNSGQHSGNAGGGTHWAANSPDCFL